MFGLIPFASKSELSKDENVFDRLMNVFDEPFMQSFHMPDFKVYNGTLVKTKIR